MLTYEFCWLVSLGRLNGTLCLLDYSWSRFLDFISIFVLFGMATFRLFQEFFEFAFSCHFFLLGLLRPVENKIKISV